MKKIFIGIVLLFPLVLYPTIINIPYDQPTIQAGIDVAVEGDTVLVQSGIYYENINFEGKNITVGSLFLTTADSMYISNTVINGGMNESVVTFFNGEDSSAVLIGFTIKNGLAHYIWGYHFGGGIFCAFANPTITNVIIMENYAMPNGRGAGIYLGGANPIIKNTIIKDNFSSECSAGIHISAYSNPILTNVIIKDNIAYWGAGIYCYDRSSALLHKVVICNNTAFIDGGGILCNNNCSINITNSTITMNYAPTGAGIFCTGNSHPNIVNSIFWNNQPQEIYLSGGSSIFINYSDIQGGWAGTGNINEDPLFIDPYNYNFHLTEDSPCIDAGDPNSPPDPDGTVADMGAYYFDQSPIFLSLPTDAVGSPDSTVLIPLSLYNPFGISIENIEFLISFDNNILHAIEVIFSDLAQDNDRFITQTSISDSLVKTSIYNIDDSFLNGDLCLIEFIVDSLASIGQSSELIFENAIINDEYATAYNGLFTVIEDRYSTYDMHKYSELNFLMQNYPNPFNPSGAGRSPTTTISFSLNTENTEDTELIIYNIKGQKIRQYSIFNNQSSITWDGKDESGKSVSTGFYLYKIETGSFSAMKKMLLIK